MFAGYLYSYPLIGKVWRTWKYLTTELRGRPLIIWGGVVKIAKKIDLEGLRGKKLRQKVPQLKPEAR